MQRIIQSIVFSYKHQLYNNIRHIYNNKSINHIKMFKKRGFNKQSQNQVSTTAVGIDLKKYIEQIQSKIQIKKHDNKNNHQQQQNEQQREINDRQQRSRQQINNFKTKKINKFANHILKNLPTKNVQKSHSHQVNSQIKVQQKQKVDQQQNEKVYPQNQYNKNDLIRPILSNYGLLDKSHFKSHHNQNQQEIQTGKGRNHQQALMDYYVKKKMEEMNKKTGGSFSGKGSVSQYSQGQGLNQSQKPKQTWQQVLQIQKQYLTQQQKIKQYSMQQIQKKLQKLSQQTIKSELQKRTMYFKDLLQNQHERLEYASKKQLKYMRQDKERIEKQLNSKYRENGRRNFVESIKNSFV